MALDIRTLVIVLSIVNCLLVFALFLQYRINRSYRGIGWWLSAFLLIAVGFITTLLRDLIDFKWITIVAANCIILAGPICLYIGTLRFLGRKEPRRRLMAMVAVFVPLFCYWTFITDQANARTVILSAFSAAISFMSAYAIHTYKTRPIKESAAYLSAAWLAQGCFLTFRILAVLTFAPLDDFFSSSWIQSFAFMFGLVLTTLIAFCLIIMVNQRLYGEVTESDQQIRQLNSELEARVDQRTIHLENANRELAAFTYSISHDLRVPVRAIDGFSYLLAEEQSKALDGEGLRLLSVIRHHTHRLDQIIDGMLAVLKVIQIEMKVSTLDMTILANSVYHELASPSEQAKISFTLSPLPAVEGEPELMRMVWSSLISNAIKFTQPRPERTIQIEGRAENDVVIYAIKDNGVGFDPNISRKLFGLFETQHKVGQFDGAGIGLAIVQHAIQRHGGKVWAESKPGQGATFYFSIPTATRK